MVQNNNVIAVAKVVTKAQAACDAVIDGTQEQVAEVLA
jgi:hypothetical protein